MSQQTTTAGGLNDTAMMLGDGGIDDLASVHLKAASVPTSSAPISREYPATSAASTAASRRSTRSPATRHPFVDPGYQVIETGLVLAGMGLMDRAKCLQRVRFGRTRAEHNESALPRTAGIRAHAAEGLRRATFRLMHRSKLRPI